MSDLLYPNSGVITNAHASAFFSAIPRAVWDLCHSKQLNGRDVQVLGVLLDHKNRHTTQVDPKQETIAERLGCSVPTVERSVARLVKAGLITKTRLRAALGRFGRSVYDLANTFALMPHQASKMRGGEFGQAAPPAPRSADGNGPAEVETTSHHFCRVSEADLSDALKADTAPPSQTPPAPSPAPSPVVAALLDKGVFPRAARVLVERFGEARCQQALNALNARRKVRDKAAWLVGCLRQGWDVTPQTPETAARPQSQAPYRPPTSSPPASGDPLASLSASARLALEATARAALALESGGALPQGRRFVEGRMRALLSGVSGGA